MNGDLKIRNYLLIQLINQQMPFFEAYKTEVQFILLTFLVLIGGLMIALYYYYRTKILKNRLEKTTTQLREDKKKLEASEIALVTPKSVPKKPTS